MASCDSRQLAIRIANWLSHCSPACSDLRVETCGVTIKGQYALGENLLEYSFYCDTEPFTTPAHRQNRYTIPQLCFSDSGQENL